MSIKCIEILTMITFYAQENTNQNSHEIVQLVFPRFVIIMVICLKVLDYRIVFLVIIL